MLDLAIITLRFVGSPPTNLLSSARVRTESSPLRFTDVMVLRIRTLWFRDVEHSDEFYLSVYFAALDPFIVYLPRLLALVNRHVGPGSRSPKEV